MPLLYIYISFSKPRPVLHARHQEMTILPAPVRLSCKKKENFLVYLCGRMCDSVCACSVRKMLAVSRIHHRQIPPIASSSSHQTPARPTMPVSRPLLLSLATRTLLLPTTGPKSLLAQASTAGSPVSSLACFKNGIRLVPPVPFGPPVLDRVRSRDDVASVAEARLIFC